jgi:hypothetical protein
MEEHTEIKIYKSRSTVHSEDEKHILLTDNLEAQENEFTIICDSKLMPELLKLSDNLRNHDWTFEMSDDSRYYRWGKEQMNTIRNQISRNGSHGIKLLDFFYPENNNGCHNKNNYL